MVTNIKEFLLTTVHKINKIIHIREILDKKSEIITQKQVTVFAKIITINDLKQFYLAKLQGYLKEELEEGIKEKLDDIKSVLFELHEGYASLQRHLGLLRGFRRVSLLRRIKFYLCFFISNYVQMILSFGLMSWVI